MSSNVITSSYTPNTTNNVTSSFYISEQQIAAIVVLAFLWLFAMYLLIALCHYYFRSRQVNRRNQQMIGNCLLSVAMMIVQYPLTLSNIFKTSGCDVLKQGTMLYVAGSTFYTYFVLWERQEIFHRHYALKHLSNKTIRRCSNATLISMIALAAITFICYVVTAIRVNADGTTDCSLLPSSFWTELYELNFFIFALMFRFVLFGLFIYPVWKHRLSSTAESRFIISMEKRIRKAAIADIVIAFLLGIFANILKVMKLLSHGWLYLLIGIDGLTNMLMVIYTFNDWKARVAPFLVNTEGIGSRNRSTGANKINAIANA